MIEILIHPKQGNYIASDTQLQFIEKPLQLESGTIQVGEKTTLHGWFSEPLQFLGFYTDNTAAFYLGKEEGNLFSPEMHFYDITYIIAPNRIGKQYKEGTFRDFFLRKDSKAKFYWH